MAIGAALKAKTKHFLRRITKRQAIILVIGLALVGYGVFALVGRYLATTGRATLPAAGEVVTQTTNTPSEEKPSVTEDRYEVPADKPRRIMVPGLHIDGFIQSVGLTKDNAIAAPGNVHMAAGLQAARCPAKKA